MNSPWHIYSLTDPRDGRVRYVGKTNDVKRRLYDHISEALHRKKRNHRLNWISSLVESGQLPQLSILESGEGDWVEAEKKWIKTFRDAGYSLVNATDGGEGVESPSAEARARLSTAMSERWRNPEYRARMGTVFSGHKHSPETLAKMSAVKKGRVKSLETRAKMSAAKKGRKLSAETRAKMSAAQKRRKASPETRAKISAAMRGHKVSPEQRAKLSAAHKGRKLSPEHRAKLKAAWLVRKAKNNEGRP
jgi:hypothetical protein